MLCKKEEKDPRKCINEGKQLTRCGVEFFKLVRGSCATEFTAYAKCIDHAGSSLDFFK